MAPEHHKQDNEHKPVLPVLVFGVAEVNRLGREMESLEDYFSQTAVRTPGTQAQLPKVSRVLEALAAENSRNLLVAEDRAQLAKFVEQVKASSPRIHISFATEPSAAFTGKIVQWFRTTIHPTLLVQVGMQPAIAAGCTLRTTNKQFDFSLRHRFDVQSAVLALTLTQDKPSATRVEAAK